LAIVIGCEGMHVPVANDFGIGIVPAAIHFPLACVIGDSTGINQNPAIFAAIVVGDGHGVNKIA
jgi:hypothetical protein